MEYQDKTSSCNNTRCDDFYLCAVSNAKDISSVKVKQLNPFRMWLMPWLIGTAYAITDEIHQLFVPERACAFMDMCIDSVGVAVGAVIVVGVVRG